jgi:hypothetical protein
MDMRTFEITENNGGGLSLWVWGHDGALEYALKLDLAALYADMDDPLDTQLWEGNQIKEPGMEYDNHPTTDIVASGDEKGYALHLSMMGHAARKALI